MKASPASDPCHVSPAVFGEQFVADHVFSFLQEGTMYVFEDKKEHVFQSGSFLFIRRNTLSKYRKISPPDGVFKTVTFYFDQHFLKQVSDEYQFEPTADRSKAAIRQLDPPTLLENFIHSFLHYKQWSGREKELLVDLKKKGTAITSAEILSRITSNPF